MRILLIGAGGQVGQELLTRLASLGEVLPTTRSGQRFDGRMCLRLDLHDHDSIGTEISTQDVDLVVNAAAYTAVDRAEFEPEMAYAVNATAPGILAVECARRGIPLVHFSTDYVFPGTCDRPLREDDPTGPLSVYGSSKLAGEKAVRDAGGAHKIFRLCWVYSACGHNFLRTMLRLAAERDEVRVVDDQLGCPTPACWIAEVVYQCMLRAPELSGTWHLAASGVTSWHGFAEAILDEACNVGLVSKRPTLKAISTADYPSSVLRPANSVLDCDRLESDFGCRLPDWREGVTAIFACLKAPRPLALGNEPIE